MKLWKKIVLGVGALFILAASPKTPPTNITTVPSSTATPPAKEEIIENKSLPPSQNYSSTPKQVQTLEDKGNVDNNASTTSESDAPALTQHSHAEGSLEKIPSTTETEEPKQVEPTITSTEIQKIADSNITPPNTQSVAEPQKPAPLPDPDLVKSATPGNTYTNSAGNQVQSPTFTEYQPAGATARCRDGSYSFSQSRRGTCSGHKGVAEWL